MKLFEAISKRKQIREFLKDEIDINLVKKINEFMKRIKSPFNSDCKVELLRDNSFDNPNSLYYVAAFGTESILSFLSAGFILAFTDLYIVNSGLGSGWFGRNKYIGSNKNYIISLSFGRADNIYRKSVSEFKRLDIVKIANESNLITEAIRLAPSSVNSQPWRITTSSNRVTIEEVNRGQMGLILKDKFNKIDLGIATAYALLGIFEQGFAVDKIDVNLNNSRTRIDIIYK